MWLQFVIIISLDKNIDENEYMSSINDWQPSCFYNNICNYI
jgi:hypothetical protein